MQSNHNNIVDTINDKTFIPGAIAIIVITILVSYSYIWNSENIKNEKMNLALAEAKANWNKDAAFRQWATRHGGLYVIPDKRTPRSPALAHLPDRDVVTTEGIELTLMNPAYMMRQMTDEFEESYGIKGKITGKKLLNPINKPDEWELKILNRFESGKTNEIYEQQLINNRPYLRYMKAMYMTEGCVKCHGILGFKEGDLRGGVSVSIPLMPYFEAATITNKSIFISHLTVWLAGLIAIVLFAYFSRKFLIRLNSSLDAVSISEMKFRGLLSSAPDATVIANAHGDIEIVNKQLEKMTGYQADELIGQPVEVLLPERFKDHKQQRGSYIANPHVRIMGKEGLEFFIRRKDSSEIQVEISLSPLKTKEGMVISVAIRDITERIKAEKDIEEAHQNRRKLSIRLENVREEERKVISREIHDEFGNAFTTLKIDLSWLKEKSLKGDNNTQKKIEMMISHVNSCIDTVREIASNLRPPILDDLGLGDAVEWYCRNLNKRTGISYTISGHTPDNIRENIKTTLFRIFQEAVTNIIRHAEADEIKIDLKSTESHFYMIIRDNGVGIDESSIINTDRLGILGMNERAYQHGGDIVVENHDAGGVQLTVSIPMTEILQEADQDDYYIHCG
jgi:PAS domain S-box-containing protein